jgi:hypothetical protein
MNIMLGYVSIVGTGLVPAFVFQRATARDAPTDHCLGGKNASRDHTSCARPCSYIIDN